MAASDILILLSSAAAQSGEHCPTPTRLWQPL